jgi:hypothetical protein
VHPRPFLFHKSPARGLFWGWALDCFARARNNEGGGALRAGSNSKSFLVLFFKKELLALLDEGVKASEVEAMLPQAWEA